ncbi:MAG: hypothetical protein R2784_09910 [Saprospiraceae bacterium]
MESGRWIFDQNTVIYALRDTGSLISVPIGPSLEWNTLKWDIAQVDTSGYDKYSMDLYGLRPDKTDTLIISNLSPE